MSNYFHYISMAGKFSLSNTKSTLEKPAEKAMLFARNQILGLEDEVEQPNTTILS